MNKTLMRVAALVDRVQVKQDAAGVTAWVTLQFPPGPSHNGWVSIQIDEPTAVELRKRVAKQIIFVLEDA